MIELTKEQKKKLNKIFTKDKLRDSYNEGERILVEVLLGISGGFYTRLFYAFQSADFTNKQKLAETFEACEAFNRYQSEEGYFEYLEKKYLRL